MSATPEPADPLNPELNPLFVFDFDDTPGPAEGQRWSTWDAVERLCRGPEPRPEWVVTDVSAIDTELGILKTGKEADVFLVERTSTNDSARTAVMAAKRYRTDDHRSFHRSSAYTEGRKTRNTRDARALAKRSRHGREVAAGQWAWAEWETLRRFWQAGVPVPYPVQIDGTEILMELIAVDGEVAPRLAQTRPAPDLLQCYFDQLRESMSQLAREGMAHGDLSAYNVLAAGERLVIIDLPQAVDIVGNPSGMDFLMRDCHNVCRWFCARGLDVDEQDLFGELVASAY